MPKLKFLILGSFNNGAIELFYVEGLKKQDVIVEVFDISSDYYKKINTSSFNKIINKINPDIFSKDINLNVLKFLSTKKFDVILVFKGMFLYPETIKIIKQHCQLFTCYNADHPYKILSEGGGSNHIINSIKYFDLYFSYSEAICKGLKERFGVEARLLPFGFDASSSIKRRNVSIYENCFLFIGAYDEERGNVLNKVEVDNFFIYGDKKWSSRSWNRNKIRSRFKGSGLYSMEYVNAVHSSLGVFNFMRKQNLIEGSHNMRTFEVPGYGGVLISNRTKEQEEYFEEGKEAIYFDSIEELNSRTKFLNDNPMVVKKMKEAAYCRSINSGYSYTSRSIQLLSEIKSLLR